MEHINLKKIKIETWRNFWLSLRRALPNVLQLRGLCFGQLCSLLLCGCLSTCLLFERVEEFKYLGTTLTNQNSILEEIKSSLKLGNACYYSVQNLLSSRLLSKNLKIKIYRTIILSVVLYGCETWSLTLREERRRRVFENRMLRREGWGNRRMEKTT